MAGMVQLFWLDYRIFIYRQCDAHENNKIATKPCSYCGIVFNVHLSLRMFNALSELTAPVNRSEAEA